MDDNHDDNHDIVKYIKPEFAHLLICAKLIMLAFFLQTAAITFIYLDN
jgi:hypothetical protein